MTGKWVTPFKKQCLVVIGASINMSQVGMVMGYAAVLLPQLRSPRSIIIIDAALASWIAALPAFTLMLGNLTVPILMSKLGRRMASLISIILVLSAWTCLVAAQNITWIMAARFLQGLSAGMSSCLTPIIIGECTSPKNRGAFSMLMSVIMAFGTFTVHTVGSYTTWKMTALVITIICLIDLLVVALTPETPSWLADQEKYEECKKVFIWLRGDEEIEELHKLIETSVIARRSRSINRSLSYKIKGYLTTIKKKEFYKPIVIMTHLYAMGQWAGINILVSYIVEIVGMVAGPDLNVALVVVTVAVQRVISCIFGVFIIRRIRRRTMLFATCGINAFIYLITAGYLYAKSRLVLPFDHPLIGVLLIHALMMTVAMGSLPLPYTIAGEIFATRYRNLSSGISALSCSLSMFLAVKTFPMILNSIGLYGVYCVNAGVMVYCLAVAWFLLPETKDRTLQDIEDEIKGKVVDDDVRAAQPLTVVKDVLNEEE